MIKSSGDAMQLEPWQQWQKRDIDGNLVNRAKGILPEMECTKQLVRLLAEVYEPTMRVLDAGCNAGHYLRGLRRLDKNLRYVGVDVNPRSIANARAVFAEDPCASFEARDIRSPLFPDDPFDIVFCCNVFLHLPELRAPLSNLLASTKRVCFVRTLLGEYTTLAKRLMTHEFDAAGNPTDYYYQNTWQLDYFRGIAADCGWQTEFLADEFDPAVLQKEYRMVKQGDGTRIVGDGQQADGAVIYNWVWAKMVRS
jgi:SAM-dependent methyltransferase